MLFKIHIQNIYNDAKYCHLGKYYGGLPPEGPTFNPRKGSCTGSYALPVPPDWLRYKQQEASRKRQGSGNKQHLIEGSLSKSRSGSIEMLPGWLGSVLSGTLGGTPANPSISNVQISPQREKSDQTRNQQPSVDFEELLEKDILPEVISKLFFLV